MCLNTKCFTQKNTVVELPIESRISNEVFLLITQKNERGAAEEWRKFSVDPQITSLEVLYSILAKAFDIKSDFGISYKTRNPVTRNEEMLIIVRLFDLSGVVVSKPLFFLQFSDWDLDAAFLR